MTVTSSLLPRTLNLWSNDLIFFLGKRQWEFEMTTWVFDLLGLCQSRQRQNTGYASVNTTDEEAEGMNCNCCVRNQAKSKFEERICSVNLDQPQVPTPWIREGYASSSRRTSYGFSAQEDIKGSIGGPHNEDIAQLKAEIREIERAIDEGERRIRILEKTSIHGNSSPNHLVKDLFQLRVKASDLSEKLRELEDLTSPR